MTLYTTSLKKSASHFAKKHHTEKSDDFFAIKTKDYLNDSDERKTKYRERRVKKKE